MSRAVVLFAALLAVAHALTFWGSGPVDDSYICFRYARNLTEGLGLVYQAGERVEGFTNPLWVMLMAAGLDLDLDPVLFSRVIGVLSVGVATWAVGDAWRRRYPEDRLSPALLVAALPPLAWHGVTGLGTALLAALLALWWRGWDRARLEDRAPLAAGVWLALACLLRQEAALFVLPFALAQTRRRRWTVVLPLVALVGWTVFRLAYYGRWFPMPWYAKKLPLLADWSYGARYIVTASLTSGIGFLACLAPFSRKWRALGVGVALHTLYVVHVGGDFMALARFCVPVLPLAVIAAGATLRDRLGVRPGLGLALVLGLGVQWVQWPWSLESAWLHPLIRNESRVFRFLDHEYFEERWARIGRRLGDTCAPGTSVGTSPIGAIGWTSRLPVVDLLGLTNDSSLGVEPALDRVKVKGHHRTNADWVLAQRPGVFVLGNGVLDGSGGVAINPWEVEVFAHPAFREDYVGMVLPMPEYQRDGVTRADDPLLLWVRKDGPAPRGAFVPR
jgi:arabinofuranosyltransferase